jgi:hypothetical protein
MAASRPERRKLIGTPKEKILFRMISEEAVIVTIDANLR